MVVMTAREQKAKYRANMAANRTPEEAEAYRKKQTAARYARAQRKQQRENNQPATKRLAQEEPRFVPQEHEPHMIVSLPDHRSPGVHVASCRSLGMMHPPQSRPSPTAGILESPTAAVHDSRSISSPKATTSYRRGTTPSSSGLPRRPSSQRTSASPFTAEKRRTRPTVLTTENVNSLVSNQEKIIKVLDNHHEERVSNAAERQGIMKQSALFTEKSLDQLSRSETQMESESTLLGKMYELNTDLLEENVGDDHPFFRQQQFNFDSDSDTDSDVEEVFEDITELPSLPPEKEKPIAHPTTNLTPPPLSNMASGMASSSFTYGVGQGGISAATASPVANPTSQPIASAPTTGAAFAHGELHFKPWP